ncbi:hypothetical protein DPMN_110000 [Dreissena polymorpha]|uniref:Uncharacterized protein n=1 Tax=Dreissena polymorpha TaxID=45954 RepID=A0A9D4KC08_DREPO|nr:hypothetical protein DPMN_110000 [Dreissena polymorpha]
MMDRRPGRVVKYRTKMKHLARNKKKKAKTHANLTMELKEAMVDWLKSNELLYNKTLESYKDTKKKAFLWEKQAPPHVLLWKSCSWQSVPLLSEYGPRMAS